MIQRNTYTNRRKSPPQKFIPRRDLFPDAELPPPGRTAAAKPSAGMNREYKGQSPITYSISSSNKDQAGSRYNISRQAQSQARIQPVASGKNQPVKNRPLPVQQPLKPVGQQSLLPVNPAVLLFLLAGWLLLWPKLKASRPGLANRIESTVKNVLDNPQSIQMLRTLGPYLEDKEQEAVYTVAGIMEGLTVFRDVMNRTYHDKNRNTILYVPANPTAKKIEAMKAIKPYIPHSSRKQLAQIIGVYDTMDQLNRNIEAYRNNQILAGGRKAISIESIADILNVVSPALPKEHREKADKLIQVLKMAEAVGAAEKLSRNNKKDKAVSQKRDGKEEQTKENAKSANQTDETEKTSGSENQIGKIVDSLAPMLNDDQKESMDIILKMAQMLAQPDDDNPESEGE